MLANGWTIFTHPFFDDQLQKLVDRVKAAAKFNPIGYKNLPVSELLATIRQLTREIIPANPNSPEFRQGNTLGKDNRHWFRAKFHERYRLSFRFSTKDKVILYVWVNDEGSLRKAGSKNDPYALFRSMLELGDPPENLAQLLKASREMQ